MYVCNRKASSCPMISMEICGDDDDDLVNASGKPHLEVLFTTTPESTCALMIGRVATDCRSDKDTELQ